MIQKPLFESRLKKPMRVACFMSGSGTNVRKIIEHQVYLENERDKPLYKVVVIFTDSPEKSNARIIAEEYGIPLEFNDIEKFYIGKSIRDIKVREEFDYKTLGLIGPYKPDIIALGGYAWKITKPILSTYMVFNVHPADLSVRGKDGKRKYVGLHHIPPMKAILAGEKYLHSSTHLAVQKPDMGPILVISRPLPVELPYGISLNDLKKPENEQFLIRLCKEHQDRLKKVGDWEIFPLTLQWIAEGRFAIDRRMNVYFDGELIKDGYRLS
jgi:folate-dependent phosphoribosylglycinamide formyltransferase PurN